jgi:multiple sugar transport system permease protein
VTGSLLREAWRQRVWYTFVAPFFVVLAAFTGYPIVEAFRLSLFNSNGLVEEWAGLGNFAFLLRDRTYWNALVNTITIAFLALPVVIVPALLLAVLVNSARVGQTFFKVVLFAPWVTTVVASAAIWAYLFNPDPRKGLINFALSAIGLGTTTWLAHPATAKLAIVVFDAWRTTGYAMVLFLAGLQTIPREYYEAASIDGAGPVRTFRHITIPLLRPVFVFVIITGLISGMRRFSEVYMFGGVNGSPARSVQTVVLYVYEYAFAGRFFGRAAAAALVLFVIILAMTLLNMRVLRATEDRA